MYKLYKQIIAFIVSAGIVIGPAYAGGKVGGATEITQIANNVQLVASYLQQVTSYKKQVEQFLTQINQYQRQLTDAMNVNSLAKKIGLDGMMRDLNKIRETKKAFEKLHGSLDQVGRNFQGRFLEATQLNLSPDEYLRREIAKIRAGNDNAIRRLEDEKRMTDAVEEDFALAKKWGQQIDGQEGINASLGLLNTQMNRMLQQNARVSQMLAQANGSDKAMEEHERAERAERARRFFEAEQNKRDRIYEDILQDVQQMKPSGVMQSGAPVQSR